MRAIPSAAISRRRSAQYSARARDPELVDQVVGARFERVEVDLAGRAAGRASDAAALGVVDVLHHRDGTAVLPVSLVRDVARRLGLEAGEAGVGHDEPANRLAGARVVAVRHRDLDEAAELERVRVLPRSPADVSGGVDGGPQPFDVCTDGEADPVRVAGCGLDRLRAGRGHVDVGSRNVERRVEVVDARHRHRDALEIDVLAAEESLQPAEVVLELRDPHRLLAQHLDGSVAAAEAEPRATARQPLHRGHCAGREERMAQRHGNGGAHLQRRRGRCSGGERGVRVGKQPVGLADGNAVPPARLELTREPTDLADRHRRRSHSPELDAHDDLPCWLG